MVCLTRPIVINVEDGYPPLLIDSGTAFITVGADRNRIHVGRDAKAVIRLLPDVEGNVTVSGGGVADVYVEDGAYGHLAIGKGGLLTVHGDLSGCPPHRGWVNGEVMEHGMVAPGTFAN